MTRSAQRLHTSCENVGDEIQNEERGNEWLEVPDAENSVHFECRAYKYDDGG